MGKKSWWKTAKRVTGLSEKQRQASRKMGVRLSRTGCIMYVAAAGSTITLLSLFFGVMR